MTRMLAVLEPNEEKHLALERCKELPPDSDLEIHVALFVPNQGADGVGSTFKERNAWLAEQVQPYINDGYSITTEVILFSSLYESVIEVAEKADVDFVIKPMRHHSLFSSVVRTSTDWNLIRHCEKPLLLVSTIPTTRGKTVLAAVDVCSGDDAHDALNDIVLYQTERIARALGSKCALVNAFRTATPAMTVGSIDSVPIPTPRDLIRERQTGADELLAKSKVETKDIFIEEGSAAVIINDVARRIDAGVIVIGTVARKGLGAAIIGNTAEAVLEGSSVDVMVVKAAPES